MRRDAQASRCSHGASCEDVLSSRCFFLLRVETFVLVWYTMFADAFPPYSKKRSMGFWPSVSRFHQNSYSWNVSSPPHVWVGSPEQGTLHNASSAESASLMSASASKPHAHLLPLATRKNRALKSVPQLGKRSRVLCPSGEMLASHIYPQISRAWIVA